MDMGAVRPTEAEWARFADACRLLSIRYGHGLSSPELTALSSWQ